MAGWGVAGALGALLLLSAGWGMVHVAKTAAPTLVGKPAPALTIKSLDGKRVALRDFQGTPVVVNFWASWCVPCRLEAPVLNAAAAKNSGRVQFIGVDIQDSDSAARSYQAEIQSPYPVGPAIQGSYQQWDVTAPPETFFVDRRGIVISRFIGPLSDNVLAVYMSQLGL